MFSANYFEPWKNYQHPIVKQLAFAISSPNLIHCFPKEIELNQTIDFHHQKEWAFFFEAYQTRLNFLDQHPTELLQFLAQIKSTRLGLRFEALLWFWLQDPHNQYYELLGHSIQSHHKGKTLGEIDFLIKNLHTSHVEHWEVCLKYYLAEPNLSLHTWIGLNPEDTFEHKLHHLAHKQFQFQSALGHHIDIRKVVIKGQLYLPTQHSPLPAWINPQRRLGDWLPNPPQNKALIRLTRPEWICPFKTHLAIQPIQWWSNGLYFEPDTECFTMLRLQHISYVYR